MQMKAAYLGLCLLASANAAQFTQSFLEYSASEAQQQSAFDEWKETVTAPYRARHLSHTLPAFIVPRECDYSAINHESTSTNPIDQMVCPDRCGSGRDFTLRIETQCDRPYQQQGRTCSSVITCAVTGCTNGAVTCPPVELLDLNTALDEACALLCGTPVAPPVTPPTPVAPPVAPPTPVAPPVGPVIPIPPTMPNPVSPVVSPPVAPVPIGPLPPVPTVPTIPTIPSAPTPSVPVFVPTMDPVSGKRTGVVTASVPTEVAFMPTPDTVPVTTSNMAPVTGAQQSVPSPQPVLITTQSEPVESPVVESTPKQSNKQSKKSKKSKSSSYCDDGSGKNGKRCLKRKST